MDCTPGCYAESALPATTPCPAVRLSKLRWGLVLAFAAIAPPSAASAASDATAQEAVPSPAAEPTAPGTPVAVPDLPPEPPPVRVVLPPPGPSPEALATWEAQQLRRSSLTTPPDPWTDTPWDIQTGSGRSLTTAEFAALTGHADGTIALRRRLSTARNDRGWLYVIGGALEVVALTQLASAGTGSTAEEDHLWRGLMLAGVGAIPLAIGPMRVRAEQARARHVALNYTPAEADRLIAAYNTTLRGQLGIPSVTIPETPSDAVSEPAESP